MNTGQIRKSKTAERFTVIPNAILEDKALSLRAIGLLCYLLRLPPDWVVNKHSLNSGLKEGRDAVLTAFDELQHNGYITVEEVRERGRFMGYNYTVFDKPVNPENRTPVKRKSVVTQGSIKKPLTGNPSAAEHPAPENPSAVPNPENPVPVHPVPVEPPLLNTDSTKNDLDKTIPSIIANAQIEGPPDGISGANGSAKPTNASSPPSPSSPLGLFPENGETGRKGGKNAKADDDPSKPLHQPMWSAWSEFHEKRLKVPPKIPKSEKGKEAQALLELRQYFYQIAVSRAEEVTAVEPHRVITQDQLCEYALKSWIGIFSRWSELEEFYQSQIKISQINANIPNILEQLKNGNPKKRTNGIVGNTDKSVNELNDLIDSRYES